MCTSKKQTEANQQNAQNSTGPTTEEGKKVSSQNATKHGLNSVNIVINSPHLKEDQNAYDILVAALIDELEPRSQLQTHFVYKIANAHWRYRRLINAETAEINRQMTPGRTSYSYYNEKYYGNLKAHGELDDFLHSRSLPTGDSASLLSRYEWRLNRELHHAYKMLRDLQAHELSRENKKSQNEPISPEPPLAQQPPPPNPPAPPSEHIDKVLDAVENDHPLPPNPKKFDPLDAFISAMEIKPGLRS